MNVTEFLSRLEQLLSDLPPEERREALEYYTEYLQDAAPEAGVDVTGLLGSPESVAADIRLTRVAEGGWSAGYAGNTGAARFGECFEDAPAAPQPPVTAKGSQAGQGAAQPQTGAKQPAGGEKESAAAQPAGAQGEKPARGKAGWLPWALLAVFTCPLWVWLVLLVLLVAFCVVTAVLAVVLAAVVLVVTGFVLLVAAAPLLGSAFGTGILLMGAALLVAALGLVILGLFIWAATGLLPLLVGLIKKGFRWLKGKVSAL